MSTENKVDLKKGLAKNKIGLYGYLKDKSSESLDHRMIGFNEFIHDLKSIGEHNYFRLIVSPPGREVIVRDEVGLKDRKMIMFGSNNYLGLGNHPYVKGEVKKAIDMSKDELENKIIVGELVEKEKPTLDEEIEFLRQSLRERGDHAEN